MLLCCEAFQFLTNILITSDLTVRLEALQVAGNEIADAVNAEGDSVVERIENIIPRVHEVALHGIRHGAALALAAAQAHTGRNLDGLDVESPTIADAMEENSDGFVAVADAIADASSSAYVVDKVKQ